MNVAPDGLANLDGFVNVGGPHFKRESRIAQNLGASRRAGCKDQIGYSPGIWRGWLQLPYPAGAAECDEGKDGHDERVNDGQGDDPPNARVVPLAIRRRDAVEGEKGEKSAGEFVK